MLYSIIIQWLFVKSYSRNASEIELAFTPTYHTKNHITGTTIIGPKNQYSFFFHCVILFCTYFHKTPPHIIRLFHAKEIFLCCNFSVIFKSLYRCAVRLSINSRSKFEIRYQVLKIVFVVCSGINQFCRLQILLVRLAEIGQSCQTHPGSIHTCRYAYCW